MEKENQAYTERKKLIELERENIELKHKCKMEELATERENARLFHERELERGRIKRAEERKILMEKWRLNNNVGQ